MVRKTRNYIRRGSPSVLPGRDRERETDGWTHARIVVSGRVSIDVDRSSVILGVP